MDNRTGFSDSNEIVSNGSSICCVETLSLSNPPDPEVSALQQLSKNLEFIFESHDFNFFADAKIIISSCNLEVPVHRCILSARSPFFKNVFSREESRSKLQLEDLTKDYDVGFESLMAVLGYMYSGKVRPLPKDVCVCVDDDCSHEACRPAVDFMVEVLYASFTFQVSELVALYQRHLLDILDKVSIDDILVILSVANICNKACERLLTTCIEIIVKSDVDIVTLDKALPQHIVKQITDSRLEQGLERLDSNFPDKHVKRIHRALDSDDVELVRLLLKEGHTNLDKALALHYAVAYCDAKTTTELLDLGDANVNHRNSRGYTVLHVAAMRKEPKIIVALLTKGASPLNLTSDGRKALQISKRLTRAADYFKSTVEGKDTPKDRLCVEILERAEIRDPLLGEASLSHAMAGDDLRMKLLYLENRVGLAKLLFPMEAKVLMDIAQVDGTSEFSLDDIRPKNLTEPERTAVDWNRNGPPSRMQEKYMSRIGALSKTVLLAKRYFPRCSDVLNDIMDADDLSQLAYIGNDNLEERLLKRRRYMEIQEVLAKAFNEDVEKIDPSTISSSSSSKRIGAVRSNGKMIGKGR